MSKRAERRAERHRKIEKAKRVLRQIKMPVSLAPYWADNLRKCSCDMCTAQHHKPQHIDYPDEFDWDA